MNHVLIRHEVEDYDEWKPYFDDDNERRIEHGQQGYWLFRSSENPSEVVMLGEFEDEDRMRAFVESDELPEIMQEAGVKGDPEITFLDLTEEKSISQSSA